MLYKVRFTKCQFSYKAVGRFIVVSYKTDCKGKKWWVGYCMKFMEEKGIFEV